MPGVILPNAYHLRCLRALPRCASRDGFCARPRVTLPLAELSRTFSASSSVHRSDSAKSSHGSKVQNKKTKTKGWRTLLGKETLGEHRSVLILRDTERKLSQPETEGKEEVDIGSLHLFSGIETTLARAQLHRSTATDEEVRGFIDSLKPQQREAGPDALKVPRKEYQRLLEVLSQAFSKHQLAVYVANTPESDTKNKTASKPKHEFASIKCSKWHAQQTDSPSQVLRGRTAYVDTILRERWKLRILEEENREGSLIIRLNKPSLSMLLLGGANKSQLRTVGQRYNTRIQIKKSEPIIRVLGTQKACFSVAKDVDVLLSSMEIGAFDLEPFISALGGAAKAYTIKKGLSLSERFNCHAVSLKKAENLEIRSLFPGMIQRYKRALWAKLPKPALEISQNRNLYNANPTRQPSTLSGVGKPQAFLPFTLQDEHWGRFIVPRRRQDEPALLNSNSSQAGFTKALEASFHGLKLQPQLVDAAHEDTIVDNVLNSAEPEGTTETSHWKLLPAAFSIHLGQILFPIPPEQLATPLLFSNIRRVSNKERIFVPSSPGFIQFLSTSYPEADASVTRLFCVRLSPSPWYKSDIAGIARFPPIEMWFSVSEDQSSVELRTVAANLQSVYADMAMPHQNLDLVLERQDLAILKQAKTNASIQSFAERVEASVSGGGKLICPPSLQLSVPYIADPKASGTHKLQHAAGGSLQGAEYEYCTTGIEYHEILTLDYQGQQLKFRSVNRGEELGSYESLTLQTVDTVRDNAVIGDEETLTPDDGTMDQDTTKLAQSAQRLLAELKQGLYAMSLRRPSEWKARRRQKKLDDIGWVSLKFSKE